MLLQRRSPRRVVAGAAAVITISAVVLLPWTAYLAVTLPASVTARHWPLAWTGLDVVMVAGLAMTGVLAIRRDRRVAFAAASTATVLLADAWFDVCTAAAGRPWRSRWPTWASRSARRSAASCSRGPCGETRREPEEQDAGRGTALGVVPLGQSAEGAFGRSRNMLGGHARSP